VDCAFYLDPRRRVAFAARFARNLLLVAGSESAKGSVSTMTSASELLGAYGFDDRPVFGAPTFPREDELLTPDTLGALPTVASAQQTISDAQQTANQAQALIGSHGTVDVDTIMAAANLTPAQVQVAATAAFDQMSADVQAQWTAQTSEAANTARISAGAQAAADLISNGFDASNPADTQKVWTAAAGAVSLIVPIGTILGAAMMIIDAVALGFAALLKQVGLLWYGCRTSANWTPKTVLDATQSLQFASPLPAMAPGTFAALALPMMAADAARIANCKGGLGPLPTLAAAAAMWNAGSSGPPMTVYVPSLDQEGAGGLFTVGMQLSQAFQPATSTEQILGSVGDMVGGGNLGNAGLAPFLLQLTGSKYTGAALTSAPTTAPAPAPASRPTAAATPAASSMSTSAAPAVAAVAVGAAGVGLWVLLGRPVTLAALRHGWDHLARGLFR
jgi:hypothetical protein